MLTLIVIVAWKAPCGWADDHEDEGPETRRAAVHRVKAQGKRTSRPPIPKATLYKIAELHAKGVSVKRIARQLGIAYGTAWNYAKGVVGRLI